MTQMHILAKNERHATETVGVVWPQTDTHTDRGPTAIIVQIIHDIKSNAIMTTTKIHYDNKYF